MWRIAATVYIYGASLWTARYYCAQKKSPDPDAYDNNEIETVRLIVPHLHPIFAPKSL
jgi:hypothetical protein